ncbi:MAG: hypothetical protein Q8P81_04045 [Nanoarchaeota archaeon]|nr:hypothetical protein [Nanoarchaeota archaeon]
MLESIIGLQFGSFYGGGFSSFLSSLENAGFFSYALPFLLIFSVVFGIMTKVNLFNNNKGVNVVVALAVGLLALQFSFVPLFFSEIFPRVGVALAVILAGFIIVGLFLPSDANNKYVGWIGFIIALIIFAIVIFQSFSWAGGSLTWWIYDNGPQAIAAGAFIALFFYVIKNTTGSPPTPVPPFGNPIWRTAPTSP